MTERITFIGMLFAAAVYILGSAFAAPSRDIGITGGEHRVALVIGNSAYPSAPLKNPVNDARAMAAALRAQGFVVVARENATKTVMEQAVLEFGEKLTAGAVGLVYYSGHGMQVNGKNFLIPVDANITAERTVALTTIDADNIVDQMAAAGSRVNLVILDACRNNPFERRFRSVGGGLAAIDAPKGTLIAYATAPGKVASDGTGANGLYTQELLKAMRQPGLEVEKVFKQVRVAVAAASDDTQTPWESSSLTGDFFFAGAPVTGGAAAQVQSGTASTSADPAMDLAFWNSVKDLRDADMFREYLTRFPEGEFSGLANIKLKEIEGQSSTSVTDIHPSRPLNAGLWALHTEPHCAGVNAWKDTNFRIQETGTSESSVTMNPWGLRCETSTIRSGDRSIGFNCQFGDVAVVIKGNIVAPDRIEGQLAVGIKKPFGGVRQTGGCSITAAPANDQVSPPQTGSGSAKKLGS